MSDFLTDREENSTFDSLLIKLVRLSCRLLPSELGSPRDAIRRGTNIIVIKSRLYAFGNILDIIRIDIDSNLSANLRQG